MFIAASLAQLPVTGLFLGLFVLCGFWLMCTKPSSSVWYCPKPCHALKVLCALLFTPPCHWPSNCPQSFAFSRTSYHGSHTGCHFLSLISFMQQWVCKTMDILTSTNRISVEGHPTSDFLSFCNGRRHEVSFHMVVTCCQLWLESESPVGRPVF